MLHPFFSCLLLLICFLASVTPSIAAYFIDDVDTTSLAYTTSASANFTWGPFGAGSGERLMLGLPNGTMLDVNSTQCFGGTFTYAGCRTTDSCSISFAFHGSSATVYTLLAGTQGVNVSVSVDSQSPTINALSPIPAMMYNQPNATLFHVDSLVPGMHTVTMTVLDWNDGVSGMALDYVAIDEDHTSSSQPSSTSIASPGSSAAATPSSVAPPPTADNAAFNASKAHMHLVITALTIVISLTALLAAFAFYHMRRKARQSALEEGRKLDLERRLTAFRVSAFPPPGLGTELSPAPPPWDAALMQGGIGGGPPIVFVTTTTEVSTDALVSNVERDDGSSKPAGLTDDPHSLGTGLVVGPADMDMPRTLSASAKVNARLMQWMRGSNTMAQTSSSALEASAKNVTLREGEGSGEEEPKPPRYTFEWHAI